MFTPIILAGGYGTRLWPLSRQSYPKQFLKINSNLSLLQQTLIRLKGLQHNQPIIVCNEEHRFLVAEQLREIEADCHIILESVGKNTAPSIALAAFYIKHKLAAANSKLLVLSADHLIADNAAFQDAINYVHDNLPDDAIGIFGIKPTEPNTGYGYIKANTQSKLAKVLKFTEKPNLALAQQYLASGDYFWNSGMFMFDYETYLTALNKFQPEIFHACEKAITSSTIDLDFIRANSAYFNNCPSESIDYAVMEPLSANTNNNIYMLAVDMAWNDVGSWDSIWGISDKDDYGNASMGQQKALHYNSHNCLVHADNRLIATIGIDDLVIIDTKDALLIAHKDQVQGVKNIVSDLNAAARNEHINHREVYRPWGKFDSIDNGYRYRVKRITVKPGAKLSLQMHHHRAEHWVVVTGTAKVTKGDRQFYLTENESVFIPVGEIHCLENPKDLPLEIIEVQSGDYINEDDIVRLQDDYGRS